MIDIDLACFDLEQVFSVLKVFTLFCHVVR